MKKVLSIVAAVAAGLAAVSGAAAAILHIRDCDYCG